ncbi:MAG TPA: carbon monoxide dehydrogenase [Armatimonadetes bacterium]|nr:carbon monoxide dehydrogenase [Armatimonadota bacterium]
MAVTIAISGKGGTGKTTLAALIIRHFKERGRTPILAVDADPNSNLHEQLGLQVRETLGDIREETMESISNFPPGMTKEAYLNLRIQECVVEAEGLDLLTMGRPEGPGCYCYVNHLLRGYLDSLSRNYAAIVLDNEAGMEHLSRRTTQNVDFLFIVSEPSPVSLRSARRIYELACNLKLKVGKAYLVLNRTEGELTEAQRALIAEGGVELLGTIPNDATVESFGLAGRPLWALPGDSPAVSAVGTMLTSLGL